MVVQIVAITLPAIEVEFKKRDRLLMPQDSSDEESKDFESLEDKVLRETRAFTESVKARLAQVPEKIAVLMDQKN